MSFGLDNLWSGAAGAVLVALFTVGYTEVRERRQQARERMGYARLLDAEIEANVRVFEIAYMYRDMSWGELSFNWLESPPSDETWREVRVPLASLLNAKDFERLDGHYRLVRVLLDMKNPSAKDAKEPPEGLTVRGVSSDLKDRSSGLCWPATPTRRAGSWCSASEAIRLPSESGGAC